MAAAFRFLRDIFLLQFTAADSPPMVDRHNVVSQLKLKPAYSTGISPRQQIFRVVRWPFRIQLQSDRNLDQFATSVYPDSDEYLLNLKS
jgi:hypothetical protein